jgi:hypothetical protein
MANQLIPPRMTALEPKMTPLGALESRRLCNFNLISSFMPAGLQRSVKKGLPIHLPFLMRTGSMRSEEHGYKRKKPPGSRALMIQIISEL